MRRSGWIVPAVTLVAFALYLGVLWLRSTSISVFLVFGVPFVPLWLASAVLFGHAARAEAERQ